MPITERIRILTGLVLALAAGFAVGAPVAPVPAPQLEGTGLRVGMMTMAPGRIFFERFGHDAIVVDDPALGSPVSYNFGFFDPGEPDFILRFIRGQMRYRLVALPLQDDLAYYRDVGRGVAIQWLSLPAGDARDLAEALAINAQPEHAHYTYDYFTDNCATRVRDAIDRALHGTLQPQLSARSHGNTYRSEAVRLASPALFMWLGFDIGLGPSADVPLSRWQEAFVPMRLADSLREATLPDGRPLVLSEELLLPHRIEPEPPDDARPWRPWLLWGMGIGVALLWLGRARPRLLAGVALPFWAIGGALGGLMLFIWLGTAHHAGWANRSLLLFNPMTLLLLPGGWRLARGKAWAEFARRWFNIVLMLVAIGAVVAWILHWLPFPLQDNARWIALLLPVHLALLVGLRQR